MRPLSKTELWEAIESLNRLHTEAACRELPDELIVAIDQARAVALGMFTCTLDGGHSVKVPERGLHVIQGGQA